MIGYLLIGLVLGLVCGAIVAIVYKKNASTTFKFLEIDSSNYQSFASIIFVITAILFLIAWKVMFFVWLLVMGITFVYKKVLE